MSQQQWSQPQFSQPQHYAHVPQPQQYAHVPTAQHSHPQQYSVPVATVAPPRNLVSVVPAGRDFKYNLCDFDQAGSFCLLATFCPCLAHSKNAQLRDGTTSAKAICLSSCITQFTKCRGCYGLWQRSRTRDVIGLKNDSETMLTDFCLYCLPTWGCALTQEHLELLDWKQAQQAALAQAPPQQTMNSRLPLRPPSSSLSSSSSSSPSSFVAPVANVAPVLRPDPVAASRPAVPPPQSLASYARFNAQFTEMTPVKQNPQLPPEMQNKDFIEQQRAIEQQIQKQKQIRQQSQPAYPSLPQNPDYGEGYSYTRGNNQGYSHLS